MAVDNSLSASVLILSMAGTMILCQAKGLFNSYDDEFNLTPLESQPGNTCNNTYDDYFCDQKQLLICKTNNKCSCPLNEDSAELFEQLGHKNISFRQYNFVTEFDPDSNKCIFSPGSICLIHGAAGFSAPCANGLDCNRIPETDEMEDVLGFQVGVCGG